MPITAANGTVYDDNTIKSFVGQHQGDPNAIAAQAAQLGLNKDQIQQALQIGGYGGPNTDPNTLASGIQSFVSAPNSGYSFGANGALMANPAPQQPTQAPAAQPQIPGGMYVAGQYYNPQQIKDFYAGGGDPAQFAQQHGITDLTQIHDLATQSRGIAGAAAPTGDAALQAAFKQYQQYSPGGANAGNYAAFVNDLPPNIRDAIRAGTYSGQTGAIAQKDWAPGGIYGPESQFYGKTAEGYASGLGPRGMGGLGGGYGTTGAATPSTPGTGSSVTGMPPPSGPTGPTGFQTSSRPMAGQITNMLNNGLRYGLGSGLQTTQTPLAGAQSAVSNILSGGNQENMVRTDRSIGSMAPKDNGPSTSPQTAVPTTQTAIPAPTPQQTPAPAPAMGQGQATTQIQKFQSLVSSIPVGNPTPFGTNAQITRQPNGAIMVTGPSLSKPYILDPSMPQDQMMQQLQAIYSMVNAPPSGAPQTGV